MRLNVTVDACATARLKKLPDCNAVMKNNLVVQRGEVVRTQAVACFAWAKAKRPVENQQAFELEWLMGSHPLPSNH